MGKKKKKNKEINKNDLAFLISEVLKNDSVMGRIFGTYSDGSPRSLVDSFNGEFLSPQQKADVKKRKKKNKKKRKKDMENLLDKLS